MSLYRHRVRHSVAMASLIYVFVQCYAMYLSTAHVFKHSSPMCAVCVAIKNYDHALVSQPPALPLQKFCDIAHVVLLTANYLSIQQGYYQSRAPPFYS